jgi:uncharacterized protein YjiS (DUF1127 family)
MVLVDAVRDQVVQSSVARIFRAVAKFFHIVAKWHADARAARRRRVTLQSLLFLPEHRLCDLGIDRCELIQAIERRR